MLQSSNVNNENGLVDFPVDGSSDPFTVGLYFIRVKLGSPANEFYIQIDTGSDILWVTCDSCQGCPKSSGLGIQLKFYNPLSSGWSLVSCVDSLCNSAVQTAEAGCTSQDSQCSYSFQYGDGSGTSGYFVSDMLYFDSVTGDSSTANSSAYKGILKTIDVNKLVSASCRVKIWVAVWFAQLNNKMGGDLKKIRTIGEYLIEIWKVAGMNLDGVEFLWSSDEINSRARVLASCNGFLYSIIFCYY